VRRQVASREGCLAAEWPGPLAAVAAHRGQRRYAMFHFEVAVELRRWRASACRAQGCRVLPGCVRPQLVQAGPPPPPWGGRTGYARGSTAPPARRGRPDRCSTTDLRALSRRRAPSSRRRSWCTCQVPVGVAPCGWLWRRREPISDRGWRRGTPCSYDRAEPAKNCPKGGSRAETRSASPTEGFRDLLLGRAFGKDSARPKFNLAPPRILDLAPVLPTGYTIA